MFSGFQDHLSSYRRRYPYLFPVEQTQTTRLQQNPCSSLASGVTACNAAGVASIHPATTPVSRTTQQMTKTVSVTVTAFATIVPTSSPSMSQIGESLPSVSGLATGLSSGDQAAIGATVPVVLIALLIAGIYLWLSRHRQSRLNTKKSKRQELETQERPEMHTDPIRHEVEGHRVKHEMLAG